MCPRFPRSMTGPWKEVSTGFHIPTFVFISRHYGIWSSTSQPVICSYIVDSNGSKNRIMFKDLCGKERHIWSTNCTKTVGVINGQLLFWKSSLSNILRNAYILLIACIHHWGSCQFLRKPNLVLTSSPSKSVCSASKKDTNFVDADASSSQCKKHSSLDRYRTSNSLNNRIYRMLKSTGLLRLDTVVCNVRIQNST